MKSGDAMNGDAMNRVSTSSNVQDRRVVRLRIIIKENSSDMPFYVIKS